ncbi:MAG: Hsp20/alpha crystallin family protein [Gammaproteobacteria bacterium]|nr:Hsp20/alpha crystallin family protein [Gammaproteobacteria bacterium]MBU1653271.1 Hsp20/alpha crystallin family protein [Gammaproteobacteria bacterium]MBU1961497.1 Hsp20/alpha crystallin family protein [Gammaproteobacteria bacterium]
MFTGMNDIDGDLLEQFRHLEREMDSLYGPGLTPAALRATAGRGFPAINVGATADQIDIYLFAPGIDPKAVEISIQQNVLMVSGERRVITETGADYYRKERYDGPFRRVLTLPDGVNPDKVEARYREGVLHITIGRLETAKPRRIEVK